MRRHRWLTIVLLAGCSRTDRVVVKAPDGGKAVLVTGPDLGSIMAEADEGCPFGYDILDREATSSVYGYRGVIGTSHRTEMLIRCKSRRVSRFED
jgi:hypothetical protein